MRDVPAHIWRREPAAGAVLAAALAAAACSCVPDIVPAVFEPADLKPAAVLSWGPSGPGSLRVVFDEAVALDPSLFASSPGPAVSAVLPSAEDGVVVVELDGPQDAGAAYALSGLVVDGAGNATSFVLPYWGHNPDPAGMLVNELLTEGSSTHPDAVEFVVTESGDLAGLAFFAGTPYDHDLRYVFPPCHVEADRYVVLHLKPQGLPEELDETADPAASGGIDANPAAYDFWYREGGGSLPGKNGVVGLCLTPGGGWLDAVPYSDRSVDSDTRYGGFGTAALQRRVGLVVESGLWMVPGDAPRPEDCARSTGVTGTRTLCRSSDSADDDSGGDWHVVPTKGASIGGPNSDGVYVP